MPNDIQIRAWRSLNTERIKMLRSIVEKALGREISVDWIEANFTNLLLESPKTEYFVALNYNEQIRGALLAKPCSTSTENKLWVDSFGCEDDYRSDGAGAKLLDALEETCLKRPYFRSKECVILIEVPHKNKSCEELLKKKEYRSRKRSSKIERKVFFRSFKL